MPCRATAAPCHAEHSHRTARLCHRRPPLHVSSPCHCAATTCMPLLCLRRAIRAHALLCLRRAQRCGQELCSAPAMPGTAVLSRRDAKPSNAVAYRLCAPQCQRSATLRHAIAPPFNATLTRCATVLIHRLACRVRALPMRVIARHFVAVASRSLAVPSPRCWPLGAPVLCFRVPTLRLAVALQYAAEHR